MLGYGTIAAITRPYGSTSTLPAGSMHHGLMAVQQGFQQGPFSAHGLPPVVSISSSITIKLTNENYLFWRAQVGQLLRSHLLMGYVDGTVPCPSPHIAAAHQHWVQQDQAILSGFVSSMSEGVLGMIMFSGTYREAWETLSGAFASTSIARSSAIRQEMAELKKGNKTINTYFHQIKALSDSLTSIGQPLCDAEPVSYILAGLDEEYDALYEVVTNRTTPIPIGDLFSQLQSTEQHKLAQRRSSGSSHYPAAHVVAPAAPVAAFGAARGGPRASAPSFSASTKAPSTSTTPKTNNVRAPIVCQLCGVPRHTASTCYKRFNRDFLGVGNDGSNTEKQIAMAMSDSHGPQSSSQSVDPAWYADSGVTHHITHELDKLTSREPYHGTDQVHTANGSVYLLVYVDDIIVLSSTATTISRLIHQLRSEFSVKDLGILHYFLGIEVSAPSSGSLLLRQRKYAIELLARAGMLKCTPVTTPMASSERLCSVDGDPLSAEEATQYRSIVGGLQYLTMTRPDLSFVVNKKSNFQENPRNLCRRFIFPEELRSQKGKPGGGPRPPHTRPARPGGRAALLCGHLGWPPTPSSGLLKGFDLKTREEKSKSPETIQYAATVAKLRLGTRNSVLALRRDGELEEIIAIITTDASPSTSNVSPIHV
ncbi:hypothetical protein QYE76_000878 [Lolium multiflorum]|uniref:Reverse transcriptase Ty1/copia-type domain-containing protein n=1 Tax=Lolium multiflorum TaxID=4521 RepID=A0AAD8RIM1_LOLMU|nr:hypothetical protein QYE76_000878 [Lolium multiflorum]